MQITCPVPESLPPTEALLRGRDGAHTCPSELQRQHKLRSILRHEEIEAQTIFFFEDMKANILLSGWHSCGLTISVQKTRTHSDV